MKLSCVLILLPAALLFGCETRRMNLVAPDLGVVAHSRGPITEKDIQAAFHHTPDVEPGSTIGVVLVSERDAAGNIIEMGAAEENKAWQSTFQDNYFVSQVVFLPSRLAPSVNDIRTLRRNAALLNCDLLLVYGVSCDYSRRANPLSVLYLTVVGAFFVPGDSLTAGSMVRAALLNVRTGRVYGVAEASATQNMLLPTVWVSGSLPQMYRNVTSQALGELREKLRPIIDRLRDQAIELAE